MRVSTVENLAIDRTRFRTFCFRSIRFNPVVSIAISRRSVYHPPRCYSEEWKATRRRGWTLRKSCTHAVTRCAARRKSPWFAKPRVSITTRENLRVTRFSSTRISLSLGVIYAFPGVSFVCLLKLLPLVAFSPTNTVKLIALSHLDLDGEVRRAAKVSKERRAFNTLARKSYDAF